MLEKIALKYKVEHDNKDRGGDKGTQGQDYLELYEELFEPLKTKDINFLEIGVFQGKSLALWSEYFEKAHIWGADLDLTRYNCKYKSLVNIGAFPNPELIHTVVMNSKDKKNIECCNLPKFDVILDDGDHEGSSQKETFLNLFYDYLKPGGIYIVEDTHPNDSFKFFNEMTEHLHSFGKDHRPFCQTLGRENIKKRIQRSNDKILRYVRSILFIRRRIVITKNSF
ncbi:methyltransferase [Tetraselmis virus 1]|uniref:Methyltransferase n=1 Tax=Tetraselmis virus 1 TaxID=2060617 RepID=A0A2P0VNT2_9VIRU|nr:methyltransferase [Tetraselmis virus 1]AUF82566.1 methyltransferase [Tetraselmis virus 1]